MRRNGVLLLLVLGVLACLPAGGSASGSSAAKLAYGLSGSHGTVRVVIEANDVRGAVAAAKRAGGKVEARYRTLVQALVPAKALPALASSPAVALVRRPMTFVPDVVTGQEVAASGAASLHTSGVTGKGVKIAVIDVGFSGVNNAINNGELPDNTDISNDARYCANVGGSAHGTAVAEIVHDMAPGAQLILLCIDSEVNLGLAVEYAHSQGARIINHSVSWFNDGSLDERYTRNDPNRPSPDTITKTAYDNGILWVNAAGNFAQRHWSGTFSNPVVGSNYEEFAPGGDTANRFTIPAGERACADLSWDDWPVATQDYNLYMVSQDGVMLAESESTNTNTLPPVEEACFDNSNGAAPIPAYIQIKRVIGNKPVRLDLFITQGELQYDVPQGSIAEPAEAPWVLAVGAVCWKNDQQRAYSSQGPTIDGRVKPDIVGYDGVSTWTFGAATGCSDGFEGTSAATPGVAGAAALLLEQHPTWRPDDLMKALRDGAVHLGPAGPNNLYGWGALCVSSSCAGAPPPPPPPPPPQGLSLKVVGFTSSPAQPRSGRPFAVSIEVTRTDTGAQIRSGLVSCTAKAAGKTAKLLTAGFRSGSARCSWRVPAKTAGKLLKGSIAVAFESAHTRRRFSLKIAG